MIHSHLMLWNVYPETTEEQHRLQTEGFFAMGAIPEVRGQLLARRLDHPTPTGPPGRKQANPYRPHSLDSYEWIRPPFDYFFAIEFDSPSREAEDRYGPHKAHRDFAWRNCRTIWSEYLHQDFLTETVTVASSLPDRRVLHFDFWRFWPDVDPGQVERMEAALLTMPDRAPDLLRIRVGRRDPERTPRDGMQVGVRAELGLRGAIPWHFKPAGEQFDGYFQMEFADLDGFLRYLNGPGRIGFAREFVPVLWSEYHTQRFERVPPV